MEKRETIEKMKLFLFGLEGTLLQGDELCDFTIELLRRIRQGGGQYLFLTNNSSLAVEDYIHKLQKLGILSKREDFLTSAQAMAWYLQRHHPGRRLYVCGTVSLKRELCGAGFQVTENPDDAECVVMGFDTELTFQKLYDVCRLLQTRDIPYLATNPDDVCPTAFGFVPDCGSVCEMVYRATKKRPVIIGKPEPLMIRLAMERLRIPAERTCCVGDRLDTDVLCGLNAGVTTVLVLGGKTTPEALERSPLEPHLVLTDASELLRLLKA